MIETTEGGKVCENVYVLLNSHVTGDSVLEVGTRSDTPPQGQKSEGKVKKRKKKKRKKMLLRDNETKSVAMTKEEG